MMYTVYNTYIYFIQGRAERSVESDVYSLVAEGTGGTVYRFNTAELSDMMKQISEV